MGRLRKIVVVLLGICGVIGLTLSVLATICLVNGGQVGFALPSWLTRIVVYLSTGTKISDGPTSIFLAGKINFFGAVSLYLITGGCVAAVVILAGKKRRLRK